MRRAWPGLVLVLALAAPTAARAQRTTNPHGTLPAGMDCSACHTAEAWIPPLDSLRFEHGAVSGFRLSGAHAQAPCKSCHEEVRFDGPKIAPTECAACHQDPHQGALAADCASCHQATSFHAVDGDRIHALTAFPLTGAHRQLSCTSCHADDRGGSFSALPTDCVACHRADYEAAAPLDHVAAGYPTDCTQCHATTAWQDAPLFDHAAASGGFDLRGVHRPLPCASCHEPTTLAPLFQPASPADCVACHRADYEREHGGSRFPTTCTTCHQETTWEDATFDHALTGFQLVGLHGKLSCTSCHTPDRRGLQFPVPTGPQDCVACHRKDYDEEHRGSGFPTTCLSCHRADSWDDARFDHRATSFPLLGAHTSVSCATCHVAQGRPPLATLPVGPQDCVACHRADYQREHGGSAVPTTCATCHTPSRWEGATADHALLSGGFQLLGPHASQSCTSCHQVPGYQLLFPKPAGQTDCVACHRDDYDREHAGSGFPTTCLTCHAPDRWGGATIDHASVSGGFRLLGAHASVGCTSCHQVPGYALLFPRPAGEGDCVACHRTDFDRAHAGSGFPTTCSTCHTVASWASTFDHDGQFFRIYRGPHQDKWASCATCHTVPGDFRSFNCLSCHEHRKTEMDDKHKERAGYSYDSARCYACHRGA